ncbi:RNA-dependent RNA polymerase [Erysiphe necator associated narnavirus 20]|nr:RNA-dependent RNA polymerase [Erysiphe necator associated narnavirus 20]
MKSRKGGSRKCGSLPSKGSKATRFVFVERAGSDGFARHSTSLLRHIRNFPVGIQDKWIKFIQPIWEAVYCASELLTFSPPVGHTEAIRRWVTHSVVGLGPEKTVKILKDFAVHLRSLAAAEGDPVPNCLQAFSTISPLHPDSPRCLKLLVRYLKKRYKGSRRVRELLQLSSFSRALPYPTDSVTEEAMRRHREVYLKTVPPQPEYVSSLREWSYRWSKRFGHRASSVGKLQASSSATLDFPRSMGGQRAALKSMVETWLVEPACPEPIHPFRSFDDEHRLTATGEGNRLTMGPHATRGTVEYVCNIALNPDLERQRIARIIRDVSLREAAYYLKYRLSPPCKVSAVKERGFKARIVTKSPAWLVEAGHLVRSIVWPMLEADPRVKASLEGGRLETVFNDLQENPMSCPIGLGGLALVSADLTMATDGFTREAIYAVWEGVCEGAGLPEDVRSLGYLVLGPMRIEYDGLPPIEETVGGCLMGLPLSWFILNLINLWACESSVLESGRKLGLSDRDCRSLSRFATCGDDLAGILPSTCHQGYHDRIKAVGSDLSAGKHLVSMHLLLFTEQMCWFTHSKVNPPTYALSHYIKGPRRSEFLPTSLVADHMVDYCPVRSIIHPGHFATKRVMGPIRFELPSWATAGPAISSSIPSWSSRKTRVSVARLARLCRPEARRLLERGIPIDLPRELGGAGFPPLRPGKVLARLPKVYRLYLFSVLTHQDSETLRKIVNLWRTCGVAGDLLSSALEEAKFEFESLPYLEVPRFVGDRRERLNCCIPDHVTLTEDDALLRLASVWAPALAIVGFQPGRPYCRPFGRFHKDLNRLVRGAARRITGRGNPVSGVKESVIIDRLRELFCGPVVFLHHDRIPPGLGVTIQNTRPQRGHAGQHRKDFLSSRRFASQTGRVPSPDSEGYTSDPGSFGIRPLN